MLMESKAGSSVIKTPVMKYHGSKFRLAPWIISFFPEHHAYVEPFGGAAGVFMQKPRSRSEVYNDLDSEIVNVFEVLRDPDRSERLQELLSLTPFSRHEFENSYKPSKDPVEQARRTISRAYMGFGSASSTKNRTGFRTDSRRKYVAAKSWDNYPAGIKEFCERLQGVMIENRPAVQIMENHDWEHALFYLDPPYPHDTRAYRSGGNYRHEMSDGDHEELLKKIINMESKVIISGYDCDQYNDHLKDWEKHASFSRIAAGRGTSVKIECIWLNAACSEAKPQKVLFL